MKHKTSKLKLSVAVICGILFFALAIVGFGFVEHMLDENDAEKDNDDVFSYSDYQGEQVFYDGAYYVPKKDIETLLVLGIDASDDRPDSSQSDFIALVVIDKDQQCFDVLHINRDTMAEIPKLDRYGDVYSTEFAQITLAHTYGADERARSLNTVHAIETLLYDIDIDHFLSVTMDVIPVINDSVGGVTLQLLDDFTFLDPSFVKDAVVTLNGDQAVAYVRERGALEDSSNLSRMERQKQYLNALFDRINGGIGETSVSTLLDMKQDVVSDCTVDQLNKLTERLQSYTYNGFSSLEGEAVAGQEFMEYHLDEQSTRAMIIDLFFVPLSEGVSK